MCRREAEGVIVEDMDEKKLSERLWESFRDVADRDTLREEDRRGTRVREDDSFHHDRVLQTLVTTGRRDQLLVNPSRLFQYSDRIIVVSGRLI